MHQVLLVVIKKISRLPAILLYKMTHSKTRVEYQTLYLSRIFACLSVILLHTLGQLVIPSGSIFTVNWLIQNGVDSYIIWAVPLFVMMSGALLLNREYPSARSFYVSHLPKIVTITFFWFTFYAISDHLFRGSSLNWTEYIKRFIIGPYDHLYFLLIIFGLYILVPFFAKLLTQITSRQHVLLTIIFFFISLFWKLSPLSITMFIPYIGYFLAGAFLHKSVLPEKIVKFSPVMVIFFGTLTFLFNIFGHLFLHKESYYYLHHHNPFIICMTVSIFILFNSHSYFTKIKSPYLKIISSTTLGIYLLHPFILTIISLPIKQYSWVWAIILLPIIFLICLVITQLLKKLPLIKFIV